MENFSPNKQLIFGAFSFFFFSSLLFAEFVFCLLGRQSKCSIKKKEKEKEKKHISPFMDPWIKEFDRLTRLADEISTDITEKTKLQKRGEDVGRLNYVIQNKVSTLVSEVAALQNALTPDPRLPPQEFRNRQEMLQKLLSRTDQLRSFGGSSNNGNIDDSRSQLLGDGKKPRAWRTAQETEQTKGKTNTGVLQLQNEIMDR